MIGDIIGSPGRRAVQSRLPGLRQKHKIDLVIANGENAAGGLGLTVETADALFSSGVDVITSGNHIWDQREIVPHLDGERAIIRPLNYPPGVPGRGYMVVNGCLIVNLIGRTFMSPYDCPFRAMDRLLAELENRPSVVLVDFHAEATSEKMALGRYLDGRVSAVAGTHTHVGTIDARILRKGTAYVTDIGMVVPKEGVIGDDADAVIQRFLTMIPHRLSVGKGSLFFNSVLIEADQASGRSASITRIDLDVD
ncbi:MAG: TIGR00282 family metallophosphoesterase [Dehalococcoidia bacterium]|nr:TIGR00282 family metallophosphoesterase [Dehalococcoidia bacterium]